MKFRTEILLGLLIFLSFTFAKGQKTQLLSNPPLDDEIICVYTTEIVVVRVSAQDSKKVHVKDLNNLDFEFYYKKEKQEIAFFEFDELKNQYTIGFVPENSREHFNRKDIKVKIKLSDGKKKKYGKVLVKME